MGDDDASYYDLRIDNLSGYGNFSNSSMQPATLHRMPGLICGVVMIMVALIGISGNVVTAIVFGSSKRKGSGGSLSSIAILVTGLASIDAALLSISCPLFSSVAFSSYDEDLPLLNAVAYMTAYFYPTASICQTASVWTLAIITIERYLAVCHPFNSRILCTPCRAVVALVSIVFLSTCYNACRFWEYRLKKIVASDDPSMYVLIITPLLRADDSYVRTYMHWMYFVFIFATPFIILVTLNGSVVRAVRAARQQRMSLSRQQTKEQSTAVMMVSVALVFLVCNSLAFLLNALEVFGGSGAHEVQSLTGQTVRHSSTFYMLVDFNNLLIMTHCSVNFFVYYNFSERFRAGCRRLCARRPPLLRAASSTGTATGAVSETTGPILHIHQSPNGAYLKRWSSVGSASYFYRKASDSNPVNAKTKLLTKLKCANSTNV